MCDTRLDRGEENSRRDSLERDFSERRGKKKLIMEKKIRVIWIFHDALLDSKFIQSDNKIFFKLRGEKALRLLDFFCKRFVKGSCIGLKKLLRYNNTKLQ